MRVHQIMSRHVHTIGMDDLVSRIRELFEEHKFHHLLVVENYRVVGVVSDRDLLKCLSPFIGIPMMERHQDTATLNRKVHQIMTRRLVTAPPDMPVDEAAKQLVSNDISCLPIVEGDMSSIGIVTWKDILSAVCGDGT